MKILGLGMIVGGWAVAMGGLLTSDVMVLRMAAALVGLTTSLLGIATLNNAHVANALWKARGH